MKINHTYLTLDARLYHEQAPEPLYNPKAGHFNAALAKKLGLDADYWAENWVNITSGNIVPDGYKPLAMVYAGHQFGVWAGQLGDGRGLLLTQLEDSEKNLWDLHLKGAGQTPYSRMGDGRAVLRSTIREYLAGHAMCSLGIASSTGLGFITSDTPVRRETMEQGAAMIRVADTHIRLGHFEWINAYAPDLLPEFTEYVMQTYYSECLDDYEPVLRFAETVVKNTAKTIADWQLVGFAHGVMNTDNLSITGSTLDYGPYGFMQRFDPAWINNHSDTQGRYTYRNQPAIAHWNLSIWLGQFLRLVREPLANKHEKYRYLSKEKLAKVLDSFEPHFLSYYKAGAAKKVGLENTEDTFNWCMDWLQLLQDERLDYTNSFRALIQIDDADSKRLLRNQLDNMDNVTQFDELIFQYKQLLNSHALPDYKRVMADHNPIYILRNHMAQRAIELAEQGDMSEVDRLFTLLTNPYTPQDIATVADTTPPAKDEPELPVSCSS